MRGAAREAVGSAAPASCQQQGRRCTCSGIPGKSGVSLLLRHPPVGIGPATSGVLTHLARGSELRIAEQLEEIVAKPGVAPREPIQYLVKRNGRLPDLTVLRPRQEQAGVVGDTRRDSQLPVVSHSLKTASVATTD